MEELRKDISLWYTRLQPRGKIFLGVAGLGLVWLLFQFIYNIAAGGLPGPGWLYIILNVLSLTMIALVITQFVVMRRMQKQFDQNLRQSLTKGRRGGNRAEQIMGRRNRGSMRQRGGNNMQQALSMVTQIDPDDLDKQYRPKPLAKPTVIAKWQEIEEAGLYALESSPKAKVEIIDAQEIGGGFFVAKYSTDGFLKDRRFMTHRQTGEPLRFDSLRNAKKALSGGNKPRSNKRKKAKRK